MRNENGTPRERSSAYASVRRQGGSTRYQCPRCGAHVDLFVPPDGAGALACIRCNRRLVAVGDLETRTHEER